MAERRSRTKIAPFNQPPRHGSNQRGVRPSPRRSTRWEVSRAQSESDKVTLIKHTRTEALRKKYPRFGNRQLPAIHKKYEMIDMVNNNKASIIEGDTGSGKSTQGIQFFYEAGYRVISLVPRKIIADGLHDRVIEEMSEHLGDEARNIVGVLHGDRTEVHEDNRIQVMTPNTFIRMEADLRERYSDEKVVIISDEIHEANLYTELATGVAAQAVDELDNWRIVAMSATQNKESLEKSFGSINSDAVPSVSIDGRPFDMKIHERPRQSVYETYVEVGEKHEKSMIFTSGKNEIDHIIAQTVKALEDHEPGSSNKVEFRKLHGDLSPTERAHINDPLAEDKKLIIVSSPAGMSGITIPGVTCVISDGTINRSELDDDEVSGLRRRYLSQSELIQQMGRAGRDVGGGVGYIAAPTVIYEDYIKAKGQDVEEASMPFVRLAKRESFGPPEIYNSQLGQSALAIAALNRSFYDINEYLPHPVEKSGIISAQQGLHRIGAMQPSDGDEDFVISDIGRDMNKFAMRPELSRGLVEAQRSGRSALQLARIAYVAAALEAGGVQDFSKHSGDEWKKLVQDTSDNDWLAQYDIMMALPSLDDRHMDEKFLAQHDLHFRRTQRALEVARKALGVMGIRRENLVMSPPNLIEKTEITHDLTAGLIDFVYEKVGHIQNRRMMYRNIHGGYESTQRYISDRSVTPQSDNQYVMGFPRYFIKESTNAKQDIIEFLAPVDTSAVGHFARQHDVFDRKPEGSKIIGGRAQDLYSPRFGSLQIGPPQISATSEVIPEGAQKVLVEYALANKGKTQKALREIADELEWLVKAVPADTLSRYKNERAGGWLTNKHVTNQLREYAKRTRDPHELDRRLGQFMYHAHIGIDRYFTPEAFEYVKTLAPHEVKLSNGEYVKVQYGPHQKPYITLPKRRDTHDALRQSTMKLPDGRDIFVKFTRDGKDVFVTVDEL